MADSIESFVAKLQEEGINAGRTEASGLVEQAKTEAAKIVADRKLLVWDSPKGLPALLTKAKIPHKRIEDEKGLSLTGAALVIVGPDRLTDKPFSQSKLFDHAQAGARVLILAQRKVTRLGPLLVRRRRAPDRLAWRPGHPLARSLSLISPAAMGADVRAIEILPDAPVLEIGYWPREVADRKDAPVSALVAVQATGAGRVIYCQMPLGPWASDPRSQLFLADALDYMVRPVERTPPPSRRPAPRRRPLGPNSRDALPSGARAVSTGETP
ncbi:hypothetical protein LCGC14_2403620 [marine sediment metagenome]|uniref:Uncharacterized protein n=1 Tax=marine sediment metagenome TaxID=412755 RepID=A0A0F9BUJ9_9ZZZZ